MSNNDRHVRKEEVWLVPPEPDDLLFHLTRTIHVGVADGPEMAGSAPALVH